MKYHFKYYGPAFHVVDGIEYPYALISNTTNPVIYDIKTTAKSKEKAINNIKYRIMKKHGSYKAVTLKEEYLHITYIS